MDRPLLEGFAIVVLSTVYFVFACTNALELVDEGQLVYACWRVSAGAVPFREFMQLYGPSAFLLNGALLRIFGADLLVIRLALVLIKSLIALILYRCARRFAPRGYAALVTVFFIALAGLPVVYTSPYPNHYALMLILAGLWAFLAVRRFSGACFLAGLLFGVAATFKQTTGIFAGIGFALFLLMERPPASEKEGPAEGLFLFASRVTRWLVIAGALLVTIAYQTKRNTSSNFLLVFGPFIASIALVGVRELRRAIPSAEVIRSARGIVSCGIGFAVPVLALIVVYARLGLLWELYFNVWVIPRTLAWFQPFPVPSWRGVGSLTAALAPFIGVLLYRKAERHGGAVVWLGRGVLLLLLALTVTLLSRIAGMRSGLLALLSSGVWYGDVFHVVLFLPLLIVLGGMPMVFRSDERELRHSRLSREIVNARGLFYFAAASSMLFLYPAGDLPHTVMVLPMFLPLLAYELAWFQRTGESSSGGRWLPATVAVAACLLLSAPPVHATVRFRIQFPASSKLKHATGIVGPPPHFDEVATLVARLESMKSPGRGLLVLPGQQLLYFLSAWPSAAEEDEFVFYAVTAGIITDDDARSLVSQERVVERLAATDALIVDQPNSKGAQRFRAAFPEIASYLKQHYDLELELGEYRLLARSDSPHRIVGQEH